MEKKELICIVCPKGCHLEVTGDSDGLHVTGNGCRRGVAYAKKELTEPTRVLTTTVKVKDGLSDRLAVVTDGEIPKESLMEAMRIINKLEIKAPVKCNQVLIRNLLESGVNLVASRGMAEL